MRTGLVALGGFLVGVLTTLGVLVASDGLYEYRIHVPGDRWVSWVQTERCEPRAAGEQLYFRCPRLHLP
jgi:hypothetical protein